ncbi:class I SAM-dependent methyltransferase [Akkermansiaceae bacterium]|nr:class I SAM-dependent methyltransferase [Akkermansiaceae bacterium]MDB4577584.1 class I SAM-dependent methyltransferase [bacterium]MDA7538275.1 class I SAM-dependent methyltransferase [Akkermansiaceae bacterium]MDB4142873.1 class I SAM-dependent methyltransferase [Akkermansiaceae bacterium]MDB4273151.1 class I SAM-dependent methyltransferase [Akkermansiaceae bacterium]
MKKNLWKEEQVGKDNYQLMNLSHPEVDLRVIAEMEAGVDVYYDRRWGATAILTDWMGENLDVIRNKRILILGAGVGAETLILGSYGKHVWINDLAPVALELCGEQMEKNDLENFTTLVGRYEDLDLPEVDLVVASFLIYNKETYEAMRSFMKQQQKCDLILVNERLDPFPKFLNEEAHEIVFEKDGAVGVLLKRA